MLLMFIGHPGTQAEAGLASHGRLARTGCTVRSAMAKVAANCVVRVIR